MADPNHDGTEAHNEPPHPRLQSFIPKQRRDFGRLTQYDHLEPIHFVHVPGELERQELFIEKVFVETGTQEGCIYSSHATNTDVPITEKRSLNFTEGAWPKDIAVNDPEQTTRYKKIIEKDETYVPFITAAADVIESIVKDNNIFDYLEQYFEDDEIDVTYADGFNMTLVAEYKDTTSRFNRKVQDLFFFPKETGKVAVAYQEVGQGTVPYNDAALFGSIWDVNVIYKPVQNFVPPFRLYSIVYNPKDINCLVGSLWTGQLCQWDLRAGEDPIVTTDLEVGHTKVCRKVQWLLSKTMTDVVSVGNDGQMIFWDIRKWDEPVERIILDPNRTKSPTLRDGAPSACVDFDPGQPSRLCAASDKGYIFNINRKSKNAHEKIQWVWKDVITPILSLQRNPAHPTNMLAVSWDDAKIFAGDCRDSWIISVRPQEGHLTAGCWSPTRCGVFMTTHTTGMLSAYDLNRGNRCVAPAVTLDVDTKPLTCINAHEDGRLYSVGCVNGSWGIVEVSNALCIPTPKEKTDVGELFDRESRREKILEGRGREKQAQLKKEATAKAEAIAAAVKAGKPAPAFEEEEVLDPAYKLAYKPGPIIPLEVISSNAKELPKEKADALIVESQKQYETWVQEEDEDFKHHLAPAVFDWQHEDTGVGSLMSAINPKIPLNRQYAAREVGQRSNESGPSFAERQLGLDNNDLPTPTVPPPAKPATKSALIPLDFEADTKEDLTKKLSDK